MVVRSSDGPGQFDPEQLAKFGKRVIIEPGALIFRPEYIELGNDVYIGHYSILKGDYRNKMIIGAETWIGPQCFLSSAGGLSIGRSVGLGPGVKIITSLHIEEGVHLPILHSRLKFAPVAIKDDCNVGVGAIILPGVSIGRGAQVGAGSVVTKSVKPFAVVAGSPARVLKMREV